MQDAHRNASADLLFLELRKLLAQGRDSLNTAGDPAAFPLGSSISSHQLPEVVRGLDKWWSAAPACLLHSSRQPNGPDRNPPSAALKEGYERFYRQLARGSALMFVSETRSAAPFTPEEISNAMTTDFQTDICNSSPLSHEVRLKRSMLALVMLRATGDSAQSSESIAIRLRELYEATFADTREEASGSTKATSPGEVKLSPQRKAKQRSWSNSERSLVRPTTNIIRKSSKLGKVDEADKGLELEPERKTRAVRSASVILLPSSPSAILESLGEGKKSTRHLSKQHTDSTLTLSTADDTENNNHAAAANPALHIEKQSSARKMRQSSKTRIMGGVDLSATLSKRLSTARLARTPSGISQLETSSDLSAAGNNLDNRLSSLSLHESDNPNHFFSIETRLELKERLVALQKQLGELLVQTKLAWMKCFADDSRSHAGSDSSHHAASKEALRAANELVTKGELLMTKLHNAFTKATSTSSCPIKEYQDLVESVEVDFLSFQQLVGSIAQQSFPFAPAMHHGSEEVPAYLHKELKFSTSKPTLKQAALHPVSFDLLSMKNYCAKVAPPYSSYLAKKK